MEDTPNPIALAEPKANNLADFPKIMELNRNTAIINHINSVGLKKTEFVPEDYSSINTQFTGNYPENGEVEENQCITGNNKVALPKYENVAIENSFALGSKKSSLSIMCKNKRNRKQFKTARSYTDSNTDEIKKRELSEIKTNNVSKKTTTNNKFNLFSEYVDKDNLTNSNTSELICESNKIKELKNVHTLIKKDKELNTNKITSMDISDNIFTSNKIPAQKKSESDEFETIDKIADMIASTETVKRDILPNKCNEYNNTVLYSNNNTINIEKTLTSPKKYVEPPFKPSFEEVETRLEEMFAGIEDETVSDIVQQPVSYLGNSENSPKKIDCLLNSNIVFNIVPSVGVYPNEIIAQKGIYSPTNYPNKKKRKIIKKSFGLKVNKPLENKLKSKNIKEENISTDKYKGPYIQLNSEGLINVVNTPLSEEYSEKRNKIKKLILNYTKTERNKILGLHVSTLSTKYDADTTDTSWLCFFCKKGPHKTAQGDLYGPYIVNTNNEEFRMSQNHLQNVLEIQRVRTEMYQKDKHRFPIVPSILSNANKFRIDCKQTKKGCKDENNPNKNTEIFLGMVKVSDTSYEVWVHEDCIVWASGIYLIGSKIIGLESAVWRSTINICSICSRNGAIVCCLQRECKEMAHIACAKSENWTVSEHDFKAYCKIHH